MPDLGFPSWLLAVARRLQRPLEEVLTGTSDEQVAARLGREALLRVVAQRLPEASEADVEFVVAAIDEHFDPEDLHQLARVEPTTSPVAALEAAISHQLEPLYEPVHDGQSAIRRLGVDLPLRQLARAIVSELAFLVAFEPVGASLLEAVRQERSGQGSPPPRTGFETLVEIRYLVCKAFDVLAELVELDFSRVPVRNPRWVDTETSAFWRRLVAVNGRAFRSEDFYGDSFSSVGDYLRQRPSARGVTAEDFLPFFQLTRRVEDSDASTVVSADPVSGELVEAGATLSDIVLVGAALQECGENPAPLVETFLTRPIWGLIAEIRVLTPNASLVGLSVAESAAGIFPLTEAYQGRANRLPMPPVSLEPDASVMFPVATLLPRLPLPASRQFELEYQPGVQEARSQLWSIVSLAGISFDVVGPTALPRTAFVRRNGVESESPLRPFDPSLAYALDRSWMMGCCPYAFVLTTAGECLYLGAPFSDDRSETIFRPQLPHNASLLIVAELEDELTLVSAVRVGGEDIGEDIELRRGEMLCIELDESDDVELLGRYQPPVNAHRPSMAARNALVRETMAAFLPSSCDGAPRPGKPRMYIASGYADLLGSVVL